MAGDGKKKIGALAGRRRRNVRILMSLVAVLIVAVAALTIVLVQKDTSTAANGATTTSAEPSPVTATPQVAPVPDDAPMPTPPLSVPSSPRWLSNPALGAFTGVVRRARTGTTLGVRNPDTPMTPASTAKILTAAAAMLSLSPDHRVETRVVQGSRPGELVLVGGGDPTLTAQPVGQPSYYRGAPRIADLVEQIRRAGAEVDSIVVDISAYAGPTMAQGWMPEDVAAGYIAPIESVMIDGARSDPFAEEPPRSATPALDAGRVLAQALGIDLARVTVGKAESGAAPVASVLSAPLRDRLGQMMRRSDNVLAETIAREVAVREELRSLLHRCDGSDRGRRSTTPDSRPTGSPSTTAAGCPSTTGSRPGCRPTSSPRRRGDQAAAAADARRPARRRCHRQPCPTATRRATGPARLGCAPRRERSRSPVR